MSAHDSRRIPSLEGVRAFAIVCVLWGHGADTIAHKPGWLNAINDFLPTGSFGVQVFFVLSGFLITTLLLREESKTGTVSLGAFYRRRAYRILPAYYLFLAIIAVLLVTGVIDLDPILVLVAALFLRDYSPTGGSWWLGHTWSLSIEEQFYLLWPMVLRLFSRRWAVRLLVVGIVTSPLIRFATWHFAPPLRGGIEVMFHTRADGLMVGCLLAFLWRSPRFAAWSSAAFRWGAPWVAFGWLLLSSYMHHHVAGLYHAGRLVGDPWEFSVGYLGDAIAVAILIAWLVERPTTRVGRFMNLRVVRGLGLISYSLYLWQQVFLTNLNTTVLGVFPISVVAAIVTASASYWFIEQPFLRLRERRSPKSDRAAGRVDAEVPQAPAVGESTSTGR